MRRVFHRYEVWEDHAARMFVPLITAKMIDDAASLLRDSSRCWEAMLEVSTKWKFSAEVNLSNRSRNRQAWLGQAACCFACGSTEDATKQAWRSLNDVERSIANWNADRVIADWEAKFRSCQNVISELMF